MKVFIYLADNKDIQKRHGDTMSTLKDLLIHVSIETAKRTRRCKGKSKHLDKSISIGKNCMMVKTGRFTSSTYCEQCAKSMLSNAAEKIISLQKDLADHRIDH